MTVATIDHMRDQIEQVIVQLRAIPADQRTPAIQHLLLYLTHAVDQYDRDKEMK